MHVKEDSSNVLHLIELKLIASITKAKLERLFSRMNRVKTDLRNRLSCNHLNICLSIGDEGVAVDVFNPNPVIELWLSYQVCCLKSGPHKLYKHVKTGTSFEGSYVDLDEFTMSDLESNDNKFLGF